MSPAVDLVLVFKGTSRSLSKQKALEDAQDAEAEYTRLIQTLTAAGLKATSRRGQRQGQLLVIIWATPHKVAQLVQKEKHSDFLLGLPSSTLPAQARDFVASPLSSADRLRLVHDYITSLESEGGLGIVPSLRQWSRVESIMALQDHAFNENWIRSWTRRQIGFHMGFGELSKIRDQFGESVALYFAFLTFYTQALFFPSAVGIIFWFFSSPYSPWYSAILTIWSVCWVEWWRIREKIIAVRWATLGSFRVEKRRPEFHGQRGQSSEGQEEQVFHWWQRDLRIVSSLPVIVLFSTVLAALLTAIFIFEAFVTQLYQGPLHKYISLAPTVVFAALVPRLLGVYKASVTKLTHWENHTHQSTYDASLTIKTFALAAIVAYLGLALSAFVYVPFGHFVMSFVQASITNAGEDGAAKSLFDSNTLKARDKIDPSRLQNQMFAYTVTNQVINTFVEVILPYFMRGVDDVKNGKGVGNFRGNKKRVVFEDEKADVKEERQFLERVRHEVSLPAYSLFEDYAEMVTQFGYVALWSTIWPLAPLMALLNNWLELRSDAFKIATHNRRPLPSRVDTIGPWVNSLGFISWLGALTNSALVYLFRPQNKGAFTEHFGKTLNTEPITGPSVAWHSLLVPTLLIALSSSHGYLLARWFIRRLMTHMLWVGSDEERLLERTQEEVKGQYLKSMHQDVELNDVAVAQLTQGVQDAARQSVFWDQDEGLEELRRATKTD